MKPIVICATVSLIAIMVCIPKNAYAVQCSCNIDYTFRGNCDQNNINFPFDSTIIFDGNRDARSVWQLLKEHLAKGYPEVCTEDSFVIREFFKLELQDAIENDCRNKGVVIGDRRKDVCYIVDRYDRSIPRFDVLRTENPTEEMQDPRCIKTYGTEDILRGCTEYIPTLSQYKDGLFNQFYASESNNCGINLHESSSNTDLSIQCTVTTGTAGEQDVTTQNNYHDNQNNYRGVPFSLPSTEGLRQGSARTISQLIGQVVRFVTGLFGSIALLMMIYGGLRMMFAGGQGDTVKDGVKIIAWASIGLVTMMLSYVIVSFVLSAF